MGGLSNISRLVGVHPSLQGFVFYAALKADFAITVSEGERALSAQYANYMKGRNADGTVSNPALVVTDAKPGESPHNYGLAVDLVPTEYLSYKDWNPSGDKWLQLQRMAYEYSKTFGQIRTGLKLSSGVTDYPHFEVLDWKLKKEWKKYQQALTVIVAVVAIGMILR